MIDREREREKVQKRQPHTNPDTHTTYTVRTNTHSRSHTHNTKTYTHTLSLSHSLSHTHTLTDGVLKGVQCSVERCEHHLYRGLQKRSATKIIELQTHTQYQFTSPLHRSVYSQVYSTCIIRMYIMFKFKHNEPTVQ